MTEYELPKDPTVSVPEAGRVLGIGRTAAYEAVARGQIPALRIGRLLRVPTAAILRMLECETTQPQSQRWG
jgi:excisionase family DNA binding protein